MAYFYGTLTGSRGTATRCGTKRSGMLAAAQSWTGSVIVYLYEMSDGPWCDIGYAPDSTTRPTMILYSGPLAKLPEKLGM